MILYHKLNRTRSAPGMGAGMEDTGMKQNNTGRIIAMIVLTIAFIALVFGFACSPKNTRKTEVNANVIVVSQSKDVIVQALTFGPSLVIDGKIQDIEKRKSVYAGTHKNPRSAIGQSGPLSYVMVVVEAKKRGDGTGVTHAELAQIMFELGCTQAFNLDGGNSAEMVMPGPDPDNAFFSCKGDNSANVRPQSDIIFFATAVPEEERE